MLEAESSPMAVGLSPLEAEAIAAAAYVFGFPLVLSEAVYTADSKRDHTLSCESNRTDPVFCLDLRQGALALQMAAGALLIRDAWTNLVTSFRPDCATGNEPRAFALVGPGWRGEAPAGSAPIRAPTNLVWVVARGLQGMHRALAPLPAGENVAAAALSAVPRRLLSAAVEQVSRMGASTYLSRLARLMRWNPPAAADEPLLARLRRIGIAPGEPTRLACLPADLKPALVSGIAAARAAMRPTGAEICRQLTESFL